MDALNTVIPVLRTTLRQSITESSRRGLKHTALWQAEMLQGLAPTPITALPAGCSLSVEEIVRMAGAARDILCPTQHPSAENCSDEFFLAKMAFDLGEYRRCHNLLREEKNTTTVSKFLCAYSHYLAIEALAAEDVVRANEVEKAKAKTMQVANSSKTLLEKVGGGSLGTRQRYSPSLLRELHELHEELEENGEGAAKHEDGYLCYLKGLVARRLGVPTARLITYFVTSITKEPLLWAAWLELLACLTSTNAASDLTLPQCWVSHCALAHLKLELSHGAQARADYLALQVLFPASSYILSQVATIAYQAKEYDVALTTHEEIRRRDECRLQQLEEYSNILYVKGDRVGLATLASHVHTIAPHACTTLCIIGNHYSLGQCHDKSVQYFHRAVGVEPDYLPAWTLLGHEYVELRNIPAAMYAYTRALEIDPRDHRPWYGLGQTYDLLQLGHYGLHYFWRTVNIRPFDSRMWIALGGCFEKLKRYVDAVYCYTCAETTDTIRGESRALTLLKIAELYDDRTSPAHNAVQAIHFYQEYIDVVSRGGLFPASKEERAAGAAEAPVGPGSVVPSPPAILDALRIVGEHYAVAGLSLCGSSLVHTNRAPSMEERREESMEAAGRGISAEAIASLRLAEKYLLQLQSLGVAADGLPPGGGLAPRGTDMRRHGGVSFTTSLSATVSPEGFGGSSRELLQRVQKILRVAPGAALTAPAN